MKAQKLSHLMNRFAPSMALALLIAIPINTPAHAADRHEGAQRPAPTTLTPTDGAVDQVDPITPQHSVHKAKRRYENPYGPLAPE